MTFPCDFLTDEQIITRWGVPVRDGRVALAQFGHDPKFPKKDPLFNGRRYWPAVRAYLDFRYGLSMSPPSVPDGKENWSGHENRASARAKMAQS